MDDSSLEEYSASDTIPLQEDFNDPVYLPADSEPNFHGFGAETLIPGRLIISEEEEDIKVYRARRTGRPRGETASKQGPDFVCKDNVLETPR